MRHYIYKVVFMVAGLLPLGAVAAATETTPLADGEMLYAHGTANSTYGTGEKGVYEVALHITEPELAGAEVRGLRIPMLVTEGISGLRAWLTEELTLGMVDDRRVTVADVASVDLEAEAGYIEVNFEKPVTIPETGLYAGYSFFVDDNSSETLKMPIVVTEAADPEGFYIHTSRTFRLWTNLVTTYAYSGNLAIQVILGGDVLKADAAQVISARDVYVANGEQPVVEMVVANRGTHGIQSLQVDYSIDGRDGTVSYDLPNPVEALYNQEAQVRLTLPAVSENGKYSLDFQLAGVNGQTNSETDQTTAEATLNVFDEIPTHRPLLEEYTGLWCAYCPRGDVGLREMRRLYPDDFIGVSYHEGNGGYEPMEFARVFSNAVNHYPTAWLDRLIETDPFCGDAPYQSFGIERVWQERRKDFSPAWIDVSAKQSEDLAAIDVSATVRFVTDLKEDHPYQLAYLLVADSLYADDWYQNNAYTGDKGWPSSMDEYVESPQWVTVVHRNVVIARSSIGGIEGSLPERIEPLEELTHTWRFQLADAVNTAGEPLVKDASAKLHVVALLVDGSTGVVINANQAWPGQGVSGIHDITFDKDPSAIYNLQGQRLKHPAKGICIVGGRKVIMNGQP